MSYDIYKEFPLGFGAMLLQNDDAMKYFTSLSEEQRHAVAAECTDIRSQTAMRQYVEQLAKRKEQNVSSPPA